MLAINIRLAKNKVMIFNHGLGDKDEQLLFSENNINIGASGFCVGDFRKNMSGGLVLPLKKIDGLDLCGSGVDLLKIDVEGFEERVILGASETIKKHRPVIIFEQNKSEFFNGTSRTIDLIKSFGYDFYSLRTNWYFGEHLLLKALSLIVRSVVGDRVIIEAEEKFKHKNHLMIIAVPWGLG
ncbi:FkbM family methyltransferase [Halothiobacillus sp. DCM-1]|uniref:FkbM family methyltransferase n=1 Tax=Halothiobacillus sp. DCM-1 TaxID=3112558 RepID=UPI003252BF8F